MVYVFFCSRCLKALFEIQSASLLSDSIRPLRLLALGISVIAVFALSLGPLVAVGGLSQLIQLKARLFPFGRGLLHAYWAPNVWALYAAADRALVFASKLKLFSFLRFAPTDHALTRGLVGDASAAFAVLPSPSPPVVSLLILLAISPALKAIWQRPHPRVFLAALVWSTLAGFMFGWHVHEKAALVHVVLLALTAADSSLDASVFEVAALVCHVTLYPLLFRDEEMCIKLMLVLVYTVMAHLLVSSHIASDLRRRRIAQPSAVCTRRLQWLIAFVVTIVTQFVLPVVAPQLPFAPLMLLSVCGAVGNIYVCALAWRVMQRLLSIE
jgi:alpha-1,3-glucosyltransferase